MTFNNYEKTIQLGAPIEIYEFARQNVKYRYTSADTDQVCDGQTYTHQPMDRTALESNANEERSDLKITVPRDNSVAEMFRITTPSDIISVSIYRFHQGDTEAKVVWMGRVLAVDWKSSVAVLQCEPVSLSMKRNGLRRLYSRQCPHRLYGPSCAVNKATFSVPATLSSVNGAVVSSNTFGGLGSGYLAGGILEWVTVNSLIERRMILSHTGNDITLTSFIPGLLNNSAVTVAPGCDRTMGAAGCQKFSNTDNYGGFPYIPTKNPFGGNPVY